MDWLLGTGCWYLDTEHNEILNEIATETHPSHRTTHVTSSGSRDAKPDADYHKFKKQIEMSNTTS